MTQAIPVWIAASQRFQTEMAERTKKGEKVSPGEALDLWNGALDHALMQFNRSGEFARLQQKLLRASLQHRLELRKIGERSARMFDMPTREEMTDVYRRMHQMQREIHQLRRELRAARSGESAAPNAIGGAEHGAC
jgi:Poly(R)-hydroxyalkanoic acid synthase subunit (PHA_synth_III_E)